MLSERNERIKAAYNELTSLKNDDERRQIYNSRKKAIMDYNVQNRAAREEGFEKGIEKGKKENTIEIVKEMLKRDTDIAYISEITKLPEEEIKNIQIELKNEIS